MTSEITHLWACDKTIFRIGIPTQRKYKQMKKRDSAQNFAGFSAATDSEYKMSSNTTQKKTKQNLVSIFILRTGTYL